MTEDSWLLRVKIIIIISMCTANTINILLMNASVTIIFQNDEKFLTIWNIIQKTSQIVLTGERCGSDTPCSISSLSVEQCLSNRYPVIQTDGYPNNYTNNLDISWTFYNPTFMYYQLGLILTDFQVTNFWYYRALSVTIWYFWLLQV